MQKIDVAAYIWPAYTGKEPRTLLFWPEGIGEWETVKKAQPKFEGHMWPRKPLWGYCDEADPEVMKMQINEAVSHGVNVFIYDWYWFDRRPFLEHCLNEGFLKAENCNDMKFYLMWANHDVNYTWDIRNSDGVDENIWIGRVDFNEFKIIANRWIDKYFALPNYYTVDGKPVIAIYDLYNFITGLGGFDNAKNAVDYLEKTAKEKGLPGVHLQLIKWGAMKNLSGVDGNCGNTPIEVIKSFPFSSATNYQYVHFTDINRDYNDIMEIVKKEWKNLATDYPFPYCPHVSIGWDNNLRFKKLRPAIMKNNTPENFKAALKCAKEFIENNENVLPLITINSWNEWTEGSYLEPDDLYGYGYLDTVKEVFL